MKRLSGVVKTIGLDLVVPYLGASEVCSQGDREIERLDLENRQLKIQVRVHSQHVDSLREERDLWRTRCDERDAEIARMKGGQ